MMPTPDLAALSPAARAAMALQSPGAFYMTGEDALQLTVLTNVSTNGYRMSGRFLRLDGVITPFSFDMSIAGDRLAYSIVRALGEGWLLNVTVTDYVLNHQIGQSWARVQLVRGLTASATVLATLASGYVTGVQPIAWPGGVTRSTLDGAGQLRSITGTNPAAGAEISETVPTGAQWKLHGLLLTLVTDATVANRVIHLVIDDGTADLAHAPTGANMAASITHRASYSVMGDKDGSAGNTISIAINAPFPLRAGYRIRTSTTNLQAGDDYAAPQLLVDESLEGL